MMEDYPERKWIEEIVRDKQTHSLQMSSDDDVWSKHPRSLSTIRQTSDPDGVSRQLPCSSYPCSRQRGDDNALRQYPWSPSPGRQMRDDEVSSAFCDNILNFAKKWNDLCKFCKAFCDNILNFAKKCNDLCEVVHGIRVWCKELSLKRQTVMILHIRGCEEIAETTDLRREEGTDRERDVMRALLAHRTFMVFQVGYTLSYEISHFAYQVSLTHIASLELRKIAEVVDEHPILRALLGNMDIENMNTLKDLLYSMHLVESICELDDKIKCKADQIHMVVNQFKKILGNNAHAIT
ncbi:hypothetical protein TB2_010968 [Malus domestica]